MRKAVCAVTALRRGPRRRRRDRGWSRDDSKRQHTGESPQPHVRHLGRSPNKSQYPVSPGLPYGVCSCRCTAQAQPSMHSSISPARTAKLRKRCSERRSWQEPAPEHNVEIVEESEKCAFWDCEGAATRGSKYCWAHEILRRNGKLVVAASSLRGPSGVRVIGGVQMCQEWDCEREAVPGLKYCRKHGG
jgi:hypothetical protein